MRIDGALCALKEDKKVRYITDSKLRGDICSYRRLKNKQFAPKEYYKSEAILAGATKILNMYARDEIGIRAKDNKIMAQYIDTFAFYNREELLDKLQKASLFNVRKYLEDCKRTYWQRLFNINPHKSPRLTAGMMKSRIKLGNHSAFGNASKKNANAIPFKPQVNSWFETNINRKWGIKHLFYLDLR